MIQQDAEALEPVTDVTLPALSGKLDTGRVRNGKEITMPQGKGTYGSKVGRPPKKAKSVVKKTKKPKRKMY